MNKTVEKITELANSLSPADQQSILRVAMLSLGLDVDESPQPSQCTPEQLATTRQAIEDIDNGKARPLSDFKKELDRKLAKHGV